MTRTAILVLVTFLAPAATAAAQDFSRPAQFDLGSDVSGYQRFLVYPHLQKGWELLERRDKLRAVAEFERAREIAPRNAVVAVYLADAYRRAGDHARAERVLREQIGFTPADLRVQSALTALKPPDPAAARAVMVPPAPAVPVAVAPAPTPAVARSGSASRPTADARPRTRPNARTAAPAARSITPSVVDDLRMRFSDAVGRKLMADASVLAHMIVQREPGNMALVDEVSYRLVDAGAPDAAARVLLTIYPFVVASAADRERLFDRLSLAVLERQATFTPEQLRPMRSPLDTASLRSRQGAFWTAMSDCDAVREILGDLTAPYGYDDFMRLGDCQARISPAASLKAYGAAHALRPGSTASRELGYQAHAAGDYQAALAAWKSVAAADLSNEHRIAAAMTGVATRDVGPTMAWLSDYRNNGGELDYRYWSLVAANRDQAGDTPALIDALEHATAAQPVAADLLQLARLTESPARQMALLTRAVALDGSNVDSRLELAFAYMRTGRADEARHALEAAAKIAPDDARVQLNLGYVLWDVGDVRGSAEALNRAWAADPTSIAAARLLVYTNQRLGRNAAARRFAAHVIDAMPAADDLQTAEGRETAERRFRLQRLHEDLGRRLTFSIDGFSGTGVGAGGTTADGGRPYRSYSQVELDYRLGRSPIRNGRSVSAYARVLADGGAELSASPTHNARLGVGLRWKPFGSQILYVAAEHQRSLQGEARQEVLLRTSASLLNGGRHSDDWHPMGSAWMAFNLYLDAAHYVRGEQTSATADLRASLHRKIATRQTFEPYAHFQMSGVRSGVGTLAAQHDVRVGGGARWNLWHGRSRYSADHGKLSLGVEAQRALDTYLADLSGVYLTLGARW